jgi:hypothetical protein
MAKAAITIHASILQMLACREFKIAAPIRHLMKAGRDLCCK